MIFLLRSPDFNALDLGAWRSLAAGIPSLKGMDKSGRLIDRIIFHVLDRWNSWDAVHCLTNIYNTKACIMSVVSSVNGSNEYKIPRSEASHSSEKATYIPPKRATTSEDVSGEQELLESEMDSQLEEREEQQSEDSIIEIDVEEDDIEVDHEVELRNDLFGNRVSTSDAIVQWWNARRSTYDK